MTPRQAASGQLQGLEKSVPDSPRAKPWSLRGILKQSQLLMNRSRMPRPDLLRPEMEKESNQIHQSPKRVATRVRPRSLILNKEGPGRVQEGGPGGLKFRKDLIGDKALGICK